MNKKLVIGIIIGIIAVIVFLIIFSFVFSGENLDIDAQKYAEFEAELECELLVANSPQEIEKVMRRVPPMLETYGYNDEGFEVLRLKYEENKKFKKLVDLEMEKRCPDLLELL